MKKEVVIIRIESYFSAFHWCMKCFNYLGKSMKKEVVIIRIESYFFCVSLMYEMSFKLHLILAWKPLVFMQIRCNFPDISYISETQKNNFQFLNGWIS